MQPINNLNPSDHLIRTDSDLTSCKMCPRRCGVDRTSFNTPLGVCGETNTIRVSRAALHMWEEPCISGYDEDDDLELSQKSSCQEADKSGNKAVIRKAGSGAVFFTGCTLRCVFCQNYHIAHGEIGKEITIERLAEIFLELQEQGANNINLVTPTHFTRQIVKTLRMAKENGLHIPVVYNTSGYELVETLKLLDGLVDIYLPDFKYMKSDHAKRYSMAADYPEVAKAALAEMVRQVGEPVFDENGIMKKGVIVRHLLLPGLLLDSKCVVSYLYKTYGNQIYISLMSQYTPLDTLDKEKYPELNRKVKMSVYEKLVDYAIDLGVEQAFIQEGDVASESFIPSFQLQGV